MASVLLVAVTFSVALVVTAVLVLVLGHRERWKPSHTEAIHQVMREEIALRKRRADATGS